MKPLLLDLRGKKVTIFGGGEVGLRKAKFFLPEAHVTVVSNAFVGGFNDLDVKKIQGDIREVMDHLIESSDFVIAATDDSFLNDSISETCRRYHIYYNRADELGTFL